MSEMVALLLALLVGEAVFALPRGNSTTLEANGFFPEPREITFDTTCKCGQSNPARIVGGQNAGVNEWPWQVALMYGSIQFCGGSLICNEYVLSAAHCVSDMFPSDLNVRLGEHNFNTNAESSHLTVSVSEIIVHSGYIPGPERNDIALLKLSSPVQVTSFISPVCLPPPNPTYGGRMATVTGWGTTSSGGASSPVLKEVTVKVLSNTACLNTGYGNSILSTNLCAGSTGKDSCQGDSGGPLVFKDGGGNYDQIGVVSYGVGCGESNYPGVYTRVSSYLSWIKTNTDGCVYCSGMKFETK